MTVGCPRVEERERKMPGFPTQVVGTPQTGGKPFEAPFEAQGKQGKQGRDGNR